jgi:hypothetical protein
MLIMKFYRERYGQVEPTLLSDNVGNIRLHARHPLNGLRR